MKIISQWIKKHRIGIGIGVGVVIFLLPFCCLAFHDWFGWGSKELYTFGLELKDFMTVWIALGGVVAVVGGIIQTQRRITLQEKQLTRQEAQFTAQTELQQKQQRDGRFASAVELLGNPHESTRIGGAYNLYFLACDFGEYRHAVCEILCAHIRTITSDKIYQEKHKEKPTIEVQTIINILFKEVWEDYSVFYDCFKNLRGTFLYGVTFPSASKISYTDFCDAIIKDVDFSGLILTNIGFSRAIIADVKFSGSELEDVRFVGAELLDVNFNEATLRNVRFPKAILNKVNFTGARLVSVRFGDNILTADSILNKKLKNGAILIEVDFTSTIFEGDRRIKKKFFEGTCLASYSIEEITKSGRSLELTKPKAENPQ
jgi:uncharacterized protein YjbI with pentapeptide repeats